MCDRRDRGSITTTGWERGARYTIPLAVECGHVVCAIHESLCMQKTLHSIVVLLDGVSEWFERAPPLFFHAPKDDPRHPSLFWFLLVLSVGGGGEALFHRLAIATRATKSLREVFMA